MSYEVIHSNLQAVLTKNMYLTSNRILLA